MVFWGYWYGGSGEGEKLMKLKEFLSVMFLVLSLSIPSFAQQTVNNWTIMVFLNGDNNLYEDAINDLNEIETIGSTQDVNIIVQMDLVSSDYWYSPPWSDTRRYYITQDNSSNITSTKVWPESGTTEVDMGDPQSVVDFVQWTVTQYPANNYALILWDHGDAWRKDRHADRKSFSTDETDGTEIGVANGQYEQMLSQIVSIIGKPLDFIGFDACLMANWEVTVVTAPYANYFGSSEETENNSGWSWQGWLQPILTNNNITPEELCENLPPSAVESAGATLSCLNLSFINDLTTAIDNYSLKLLALNSQELKSIITNAANNVLRFYSYTEVDLGHLVTLINNNATNYTDVTTAGSQVLDAIDNVVLVNEVIEPDYSNAQGISIYMPIGSWDEEYDPDYASGQGALWSQQTNWDELITTVIGAVRTEDEYEDDDTSSIAKPIIANAAAQIHNLYPRGDRDWLYFDAKMGADYTIRMPSGDIDSYLNLYSTDAKTLIKSDDDGAGITGGLSKITWTATKAGRYYIMVEDYSTYEGYGGETGDYTIQLDEEGGEECSGTQIECLQEGICTGTISECINNQWVCNYPDGYGDEICGDNIDNDCDGYEDESCDGGVDSGIDTIEDTANYDVTQDNDIAQEDAGSDISNEEDSAGSDISNEEDTDSDISNEEDAGINEEKSNGCSCNIATASAGKINMLSFIISLLINIALP